MADVTEVCERIWNHGIEEATDAELREVIEWLRCELGNRRHSKLTPEARSRAAIQGHEHARRRAAEKLCGKNATSL